MFPAPVLGATIRTAPAPTKIRAKVPTNSAAARRKTSSIRAWRLERGSDDATRPGEARKSSALDCRPAALREQKASICGPFLKAAGLGFEPRLLGPEPSVLPLDDPARGLGL